jgi:flagellar motor switch protein FliM
MEPRFTAEELDAIQAAISQTARKPGTAPTIDAMPVALIADDRAAERARPNGLRIGNRWAALARERLQRLTGGLVESEVVGAETVEAGSLRDELGSAWARCIDAEGRPSPALVLVNGPIIDALSALLLGGRPEGGRGNARRPSPASLRLFDKAGLMLCEAAATAWRDEQSCEATVSAEQTRVDQWRRDLRDNDLVVVVTLSIGEPTAGILRFIARPEALVIPPAPFAGIPAPSGSVQDALGGVPIEVRVELGKIRITMNELLRLQPGALIPLHKFVDDPLPVALAGKVKAYGRAIVTRGVMAVELTEVNA